MTPTTTTTKIVFRRCWNIRWALEQRLSLQSRRCCDNTTEICWSRPNDSCSAVIAITTRHFASSSSSSSSPDDWRKRQLQQLQRKFQDTSNTIESDEELQPMWKEMEGRVTRRKPRTMQQTGGRTGRVNVRKTDEDVWAQEGMYQVVEDENDDDCETNKKEKK
ncbi:hypothetical protein IV203_021868 [Nitzschia inconspicua]|uniref:Uncharacterized protein n=1 Tax=Nitzschia inconspicua TaxID=303405 RepID=A0A9K3KII6_9STRA|nr:hypothetical protein IV203_021868 [Nitzschia inconspicua]